MKKFHHLSLLFIFLTVSCMLGAQNLEIIFSSGYNTDVADFGRFSDGRYVLAMIDSPIPGGIYTDTLSVRIIDSTGSLNKTTKLSPPHAFENFVIDHVLILPGDEFLVSYSGGDCDAGGYAYYLEKFDSLGQQAWLIQLDEYFYPSNYGIGLDSNILVASGSEVEKIASENGSILWRTEDASLSGYEMIFVPGTEDVIISDQEGLKYYQQYIILGNIFYLLKASEYIPQQFGSIGRFQTFGDGIFYAYKYYDKEIIRFRADLKAKNFLTTPGSFVDMCSRLGGLVLLQNNDVNTYRILFYDSTGLKINDYLSGDRGLRPRKMKCNDNGLALVGAYTSGPDSKYDPQYHFAGRGQGWFRYFPQYYFEDNPHPVSLAITNIVQQAPISYDSAWTSGFEYTGYVHDFNGGDFKLEITNTGNESVNSFWVNIAFDVSYNVWFCPPFSVKQKYFNEHEILPGESVWVEFGDVEAYHQISFPDQFCFWTSGNNSLPDYQPQDDVFCMDRIVKTQEAIEPSFSVYPNPANTELNIISSSNKYSTWKIHNILGQKIKTGQLNSDSELESIDVENIPPGVYYLVIGRFSKTIIIQH